MKKTSLKNLALTAILLASLGLTSCRNTTNQDAAGTEDAQDANGDTQGSKDIMDNEDSGRAAGEAADGIQTPTDTLPTTHKN